MKPTAVTTASGIVMRTNSEKSYREQWNFIHLHEARRNSWNPREFKECNQQSLKKQSEWKKREVMWCLMQQSALVRISLQVCMVTYKAHKINVAVLL